MSLPSKIKSLLLDILDHQTFTFAARSILELLDLVESECDSIGNNPQYKMHKASVLEGCRQLLSFNLDQDFATRISEAIEDCQTEMDHLSL
jgi:hypothetical protein